jgi:hypothetical protein
MTDCKQTKVLGASTMPFIKANITKIEENKVADKPKGFGNPTSWFKVENGVEYQIRILPPWTEEGDNAGLPYKKYYQHWNVGPDGKRVNCPAKMTEGAERCAICEEIEILKASDLESDKKEAQRMRASRRYVYQVIDRDDPYWTSSDEAAVQKPELLGTPKIKFLSLGWNAHKSITDIFASADYGDVSDPFDGTDLTMRRTGTGNDTEYSIVARRKDSKLFEKDSDIEAVADALFNMDEEYNFRIPTFEDTHNTLLGLEAPKKGSGEDKSSRRALTGKLNSSVDPLEAVWKPIVSQGKVMSASELVDSGLYDNISSVSDIPGCYTEEPDPSDSSCIECILNAHCGVTFAKRFQKKWFGGPALDESFLPPAKDNDSASQEPDDVDAIKNMLSQA